MYTRRTTSSYPRQWSPKLVPTVAVEVIHDHQLGTAAGLVSCIVPGSVHGVTDLAGGTQTTFGGGKPVTSPIGPMWDVTGTINAINGTAASPALTTISIGTMHWRGRFTATLAGGVNLIAVGLASSVQPFTYGTIFAGTTPTNLLFGWPSGGTFTSLQYGTFTVGQYMSTAVAFNYGGGTLGGFLGYVNGAFVGSSGITGNIAGLGAATFNLGGDTRATATQTAVGHIYSRNLSADEMRWLDAEPFIMLRPVVRRTYFLPAFASSDVAIAGVQGTSGIGTLSAEIDKGITGVQGASGIGSLNAVPGGSVAGVAAVSQIGTLLTEIDKSLSGVAATASVGTVTITDTTTASVTGVAANSGIGSLSTAISGLPNLIGVQGTGHAGTLGAQASDFRMVGVQAIASTFSLFPIVTPNFTNIFLTGVQGSSHIGTLGKIESPVMVGVHANGQVGIVKVFTFHGGLRMTQLECVSIPSSDVGAQVSLSWSDDQGVSYSSPIMQKLGGTGQFRTNLQWRHLGMARSRVFSLEWSTMQQTAVNGLWLTFEVSKT